MAKAIDKKIEEFSRYAASAFKNHVIREDLNQGLFRSWRCGAPGDGNHHFHVTTTPGRIMVAGDNGTLVVERTEDMVAWCRRSIDSIGYFASKVPHEIPTQEWDADVAREWVQDQVVEENANEEPSQKVLSKLAGLLELLDSDEAHQHEFCSELADSGLVDGCDWPDLRNWNSNFLWCREDLKWFLAHYPPPTP